MLKDQAGQKTGGKCEIALKWHVPASRYLGTAALVSAQTWTRFPRDTLDRVERAAAHSVRERPRIEGRLNVDFHTGMTLRPSTRREEGSRRTRGVILARRTAGRRRLGRWSWLCCGRRIGWACASWRRGTSGPLLLAPPLCCTAWSGDRYLCNLEIRMIQYLVDGRRRQSVRLPGGSRSAPTVVD